MVEKIKNIQDTVARLLFEQPDTRDDDKLLILKVWAEQNPLLRHPKYSFLGFAVDFLEGKYAEPESIRRSRQKIQEKYPSLRGGKYYERHKEELCMREEIKKL